MNTKDIAEALVNALNAGDWDTVASYLADDFQFTGPVPEPQGAMEWIGTNRTLADAMPDFALNLRILSVDGNQVKTVDRLTGTHTASLDLTLLGMGVIPPSGKAISLPEEEGVAIVEGGKVVSIHISPPPGGGLMGLLAQLGVEPPQM